MTGQWAWCTTLSETLPISARLILPRPLLPTARTRGAIAVTSEPLPLCVSGSETDGGLVARCVPEWGLVQAAVLGETSHPGKEQHPGLGNLGGRGLERRRFGAAVGARRLGIRDRARSGRAGGAGLRRLRPGAWGQGPERGRPGRLLRARHTRDRKSVV